MSNKRTVGIVVAVIVVLVIGAIAFASTRNNSMNNPMTDSHSSDDGHHDGESSTSNVPLDTNQITYKSFDVVQKTIKVKKGTTVTWTNEDTAKHDVTPVNETDDFKTSELFGKGETYSVTFNTVGSYAYYCSPHPYMKGVVEVTE